MASAAVMAAVDAKIAANWPHCPIRALNAADGAVPADRGAFLVVQYPVAAEDQASIGAPGSNLWREEGAFRVALAVPRGKGLGAWPGRLDALRAALRGQVFDGVRTYNADPPVIDDGSDRGAFVLLSFAVAYEFDVFG